MVKRIAQGRSPAQPALDAIRELGVQAKPGFLELAAAAKLSYSGRFANVEMFTQEMPDGTRRQVMIADAADAGFIVFVPAIGDGIDPAPLPTLIATLSST